MFKRRYAGKKEVPRKDCRLFLEVEAIYSRDTLAINSMIRENIIENIIQGEVLMPPRIR
jgi:hypothetical protein